MQEEETWEVRGKIESDSQGQQKDGGCSPPSNGSPALPLICINCSCRTYM